MNLMEAQTAAWLSQADPPQTIREALGRLQGMVEASRQAFEAGQVMAAQERLENALIHLLSALKTLDIQADQAILRALARLEKAGGQKTFHVFPDHVEVWAGEDYRGQWPLLTREDYDALVALSHLFGCDLEHHEARQLRFVILDRVPAPPG